MDEELVGEGVAYFCLNLLEKLTEGVAGDIYFNEIGVTRVIIKKYAFLGFEGIFVVFVEYFYVLNIESG